ncbi:MAG: hypothetical protein GYA57_19820 [Myxococcales bacterium]|nr:hypothetical protein [Myxococcales bacterium]
MKILVLNSGSSSLKYQLIDAHTEEVVAKGLAECVGIAQRCGRIIQETKLAGKIAFDTEMNNHDEAMDRVFALLTDPVKGVVKSIDEIVAVGHRVVHGGEKFVDPTLITDDVLEEVEKMSQLAPLHNPPNLAGIRACMRLMPGIPQVAVFDTAFHATIPDYAYMYALPYDYYTAFGVRRSGGGGGGGLAVGLVGARSFLDLRLSVADPVLRRRRLVGAGGGASGLGFLFVVERGDGGARLLLDVLRALGEEAGVVRDRLRFVGAGRELHEVHVERPDVGRRARGRRFLFGLRLGLRFGSLRRRRRRRGALGEPRGPEFLEVAAEAFGAFGGRLVGRRRGLGWCRLGQGRRHGRGHGRRDGGGRRRRRFVQGDLDGPGALFDLGPGRRQDGEDGVMGEEGDDDRGEQGALLGVESRGAVVSVRVAHRSLRRVV